MTTSVKYYASTMPGAPVLSGTAGALATILDACLVDGWGLKTVDTLVVAGGVATANISTGSAAVAGGVVLVSGATPAGLNGEKRVIAAATNTVTFDATGISDQTATGTITMKNAPLGWTRAFTGTNVRSFKGGASGTGFYLRVDDTGPNSARVVGYEVMTDVNTGVSPFPTDAQRAGGGHWPKSEAASSASRPWMIVGDDRGFYIHSNHHSSIPGYGITVYFGDILSVLGSDPYSCALHAMGQVATVSLSGSTTEGLGYSNGTTASAAHLARSYTGVGGSTQTLEGYDMVLPSASSGISGTQGTNSIPYPNPPDNSLLLSPFRISELGSKVLRGVFPGFYAVPQAVPDGVFSFADAVTGISALPGRTLRATKQYNTGGGTSNGTAFIDTTGPWR